MVCIHGLLVMPNLLIIPPADDPVEPVKGARRHEQDVGGVHLDGLPSQLPRVLLGHADDGSLQEL